MSSGYFAPRTPATQSGNQVGPPPDAQRPTLAQALAGRAAADTVYGRPHTNRPANRPADRHAPGPSVFALVAVIAAIALSVVGITVVDWVSRSEGPFGFRASFSDVRHLIAINRSVDHYPWDIDTYYTYGGFVVLGVALVVALLASFDTPWRHPFRVVTVLAGLIGLGWTFDVVVHLVKFGGGNFGDIGGYYGAGPWLTMIGFLLVIAAGLMAGSNVTARYR